MTATEPTRTIRDRVIRVFISSTFRDMMRERDLLVKQVFPELRRKCAKRFVTFTEVDLRWGITEAQANEGQVLPLCLAEIERSRPYFIGLLGERYGWIPETIRPEVIAREPWLHEHLEGRTSVTELEILHGVLNRPQMHGHAFFYFRNPDYVNTPSLTEDERRDLVEHTTEAEVKLVGPAEAARRTAERQAKLAALKQRIRDCNLPLTEPYADPRALAEIVRRQFGELIDRLYPEDQTPDTRQQEWMAHEAHAQSKLFACIDRPAHLAVLDTFAEPTAHDGKGLVVMGESGSGKTVLLAAWARDWGRRHPDHFLFQHYFGATPESASPEGFLRRLLGELKSRFGMANDIPTAREELRDALPVWLARTIGNTRIVLVLDGLNQVQGEVPDCHLRFLPHHFPPHVIAIASSPPGPALEALRERGWAEHELPLASGDEVGAMVDAYLGIHARALEPELRQQLVSAPGSRNPLFLRTVLEELRQFGSFERLPQSVHHYLESGDLTDLFGRVVSRWQQDFDGREPTSIRSCSDLVRRALTHLWAARQGLSESEWLDLLGDGSTPLPRTFWTPLFLALEPHLSQRLGLFAFGHDYLRQAVEAAFVSTDDLQRSAHLYLADYFESHPGQHEMTTHKAAEWPWQLHAAAAWERLLDCLVTPSLFLALHTDEKRWEYIGYWRPLRESGVDLPTGCAEIYRQRKTLPAGEPRRRLPFALGQFLTENGQFSPACGLFLFSLIHHLLTSGLNNRLTLTDIRSLAYAIHQSRLLAVAETLYRFALRRCQRVLGVTDPDSLGCAKDLSVLLGERGRFEQAELLAREVCQTAERILGPEHPLTLECLNGLTSVLFLRRDYRTAETVARRIVEGRARVLGREHPDTLASINNLGVVCANRSEGESLLRQAMEHEERLLGPEHPSTSMTMNTLADMLKNRGEFGEAESLMRRVLSNRIKTLGSDR